MSKIQSSLQSQLRAQAKQLRQDADSLPRGPARDALLLRADKIESTAIIEGWANSAGLRCPEGSVDGTAHNEPHMDAGADPKAEGTS